MSIKEILGAFSVLAALVLAVVGYLSYLEEWEREISSTALQAAVEQYEKALRGFGDDEEANAAQLSVVSLYATNDVLEKFVMLNKAYNTTNSVCDPAVQNAYTELMGAMREHVSSQPVPAGFHDYIKAVAIGCKPE